MNIKVLTPYAVHMDMIRNKMNCDLPIGVQIFQIKCIALTF